MLLWRHLDPSLFPTVRRLIISINSALLLATAFFQVIVCLDVVRFDPKTTKPQTTVAIAPTIAAASAQMALIKQADNQIAPAAMAIFESNMAFRPPFKVLA